MTQIGTWLKRARPIAHALLCAFAPATPQVARAANCVYTSSELVTRSVAPNGVLLVKVSCSGEGEECRKAPALRVVRGDAPVAGSVEVIHQTPDRLWATFRPTAPWQEGAYTVHNLPRSWEEQSATFEVTSATSGFAFDAAAVQLSFSAGVQPAGERICCPSRGEGSCYFPCGGLDGVRRVAEVRAGIPTTPPSVVWRIADADADGTTGRVGNVFQFDSARPRYCVEVSAWDAYDDSRHAFERCFEASSAEFAEVGKVTADWSSMALDQCSAPPIVGGYGFDTSGEPDPEALPSVSEPLRAAFCAAQRKSCGDPSRYAPDAGFESRCLNDPSECQCRFVLHYCPEFAESPPSEPPDDDVGAPADGSDPPQPASRRADGCALATDARSASWAAWAVFALLFVWRRRKA